MESRAVFKLAFVSLWLTMGSGLVVAACGKDDGGEPVAVDASIDSTSCRQSDVQCGSTCTNVRTDPKNCGGCGTTCGATEVCDLGRCAAGCSTGLKQCGQSCIDTTSDPTHCGSCEKACGATEQCGNGQCSCPAESAQCGGTCAQLESDPKNCGSCGTTCTSTMGVCSQGACAAGCATGLTDCNGACVDLNSDDI